MESPAAIDRRPHRTQASAAHIPALDGIRGLAILFVMVYHFAALVRPSGALGTAAWTVARGGWFGVDLFFVLSGFLITGILHDAKGGAGYFRNFYARRALRIFPLYYGCLALLFVAVPLVHAVREQHLRTAIANQGWYWTYLTNVAIACRGSWDPVPWPTNHLWSLAVEEQFYLLWPLLVAALERRAMMRLCGAVALGALALRCAMWSAGASPVSVYVLTLTRMDALAVGAMLALAARAPDGGTRVRQWMRRAGWAAAAALLALALLRRGLSEYDAWTQTVGFSLLAVLFGAWVSAAAVGAGAARLLARRELRAFGRYSYGIYVLHYPLLAIFALRLHIDALPRVLGSPLPALAGAFAAFTGLSLGVAWVSWHAFERHFLALKRRFEYRRPARATVEPTHADGRVGLAA